MRATKTRLAALAGAAAVAASVLLAAPAANAFTADGEPVRSTAHFTVAGARYTVHEDSYGTAMRTLHIGGYTAEVPAHYRIRIVGPGAHVDADVRRGLEKADHVFQRFAQTATGERRFASRHAFLAAEHAALHVSAAAADAEHLKELRRLSLDWDLEATIGATDDYLHSLPAGARPDFSLVKTVRSPEYRGVSTVSGDDAEYWTATVRDTQDGVGIVFDAATRQEAVFRF